MTFQERYKYNSKTDLLGKGGFARVYRATDTLLDREVAIKIFNTSEQEHYTVVEEIKKVIKFKHANLLSYYDVAIIEHTTPLGETEAIQIGIMELANAGDLKQFARNNPGSPVLLRFLHEVLSGLEYLHKKGIIHRDLKPQNILLVDEDGEVTAKIADFGISKDMETGTNSSSMAIGTIEYMAPEQFNPAKYGINGKIGPSVDLWSFGIMVHELLTNQPLFGQRNGNTTAEQIMSAILSTDIPDGIENLPEPYRNVVKNCLVKDAKKRVQTAGELSFLLSEKTSSPPADQAFETVFLKKPKIEESTETVKIPLPKKPPVADKNPVNVPPAHSKNFDTKTWIYISVLALSLIIGGFCNWYFGLQEPTVEKITPDKVLNDTIETGKVHTEDEPKKVPQKIVSSKQEKKQPEDEFETIFQTRNGKIYLIRNFGKYYLWEPAKNQKTEILFDELISINGVMYHYQFPASKKGNLYLPKPDKLIAGVDSDKPIETTELRVSYFIDNVRHVVDTSSGKEIIP